MDLSKRFEFTRKFFRRIYHRQIINAFGNNWDKCYSAIKSKIRTECLLTPNLNKKYALQHLALFELDGIGLVKVSLAETPENIVLITISETVTEPALKQQYQDWKNNR